MEIANFEPFKSPATIQIVGPTGSGKTQFTKKLIHHKAYMFPKEPPIKIMYCYNIYQDAFEDLERVGVALHQGLPTEEFLHEFTTVDQHTLIVLDDLMKQVIQSKHAESWFTQKSHHLNMSVVFISQNLFCKNTKTISLNCHYLVLFRNFRDGQQINCLARQIYPKNSQQFLTAYQDATSKAYGYLLIDLSPHSNDITRLRAHIFPEDRPIIVYKC